VPVVIFVQNLSYYPNDLKILLVEIQLPADDGLHILDALQQGTALLASDGSYMQSLQKGSHAYKLTTKQIDDGHISGSALSPNSNKMSSSPMEHYGAIAVLTVLVVLIQHHKVCTKGWPGVTLLIDNKEVVDRGDAKQPSFMNVNQYLTHDYNLWMVMGELQYRIPLRINYEWIRSHQTAETNTDINQYIKLNNEVDILATEAYSDNTIPPERVFFLAGQVCLHQSGYHVQDVFDAIRSRESDNRLLEYYVSKGWRMHDLKIVDWRGMEKFLTTQSPTSRCKILQSMHNWQNTGYQKVQFEATHPDQSHSMGTVQSIATCRLGCGACELPFHYMYCAAEDMCLHRQSELKNSERH
jgi:hypothetical protein